MVSTIQNPLTTTGANSVRLYKRLKISQKRRKRLHLIVWLAVLLVQQCHNPKHADYVFCVYMQHIKVKQC
jgi:hypothetical protein